jgi:dipeptidyl aminopeptidase/acylaminoacyl peptidase
MDNAAPPCVSVYFLLMKALVLALAVVTCAVIPYAAQSPRPAPANDARGLSIEHLIDIRHPSNAVWSPDGRRVAFLSERAGIANIFVADIDQPARSTRAAALTRFADGLSAGLFWSADSQGVYFPRQGDLWRVTLAGGEPTAVWTTAQPESNFTLSPDGARVAFVRDGSDLIVRSLADGKEAVVVRGDGKAIGGVTWAPDGARLLFNAGATTIRHEQTPDYSGVKIIYTVSERRPGENFVVAATGGVPMRLPEVGGAASRGWTDPTHFVVDRQSADFKRRTISLADTTAPSTLREPQGRPEPGRETTSSGQGGMLKTLYEDVDDKFWSIPGQADPGAQPSPDGKWIAFVSDKDGWDHLYVMRTAGGAATQVTKGKFEVWRPSWSPDSTRIAFDANVPDHPGDRHLGVAAIGQDPARATVTMITSGKGTNIAPVWSPDGRRLLYQHTDPQSSADLWVVNVTSTAATRVSDSMPAAIDRDALVEPEFVHYPGPDGQQVPGWLFVPKHLDRSKKHPAIVWIHGDGVNQSYNGWHVQRNYAVYYSFHQYLLQKGYVVFAPDYRGSIGYGRAWRQGVYMDVGGKDAKDAWMAANYLKALPYVDGERLGVWGLSYGGFFTLIAATDQPTLFRAAVDVAGVADYAMYYEDPYHGGWTASRIGTPEQNPAVFAQASPLSHVDRLARPLLVLHGTSDVNVPYLHSVRLIDELLKKGKGDLVSFMTYPGEFHYFTREHVLRDAWHRVEDFFDANLKRAPIASH